MIKAFIICFLLMTSSVATGQSISVSMLDKRPVLDGQESDWNAVPGHTVQLNPIKAETDLKAREITVKVGHFDGEVFFFLKWPDQTEDLVHKPWKWNPQKQRYTRGDGREDRLALQFEMSGEYSTDWANANDFKADMWHWKSSRSNPLGLVHDKYTVLSTNKLLRAAPIPATDGSKRYVLRKSDSGDPLYRSLRYASKQQEVMPKYQLLEPSGSIADIKAKGVWQEGHWHLELSRQLDTGHDDDARFIPGQTYRGGIAIFDATENDQHLISETLQFQF